MFLAKKNAEVLRYHVWELEIKIMLIKSLLQDSPFYVEFYKQVFFSKVWEIMFRKMLF